MNVIQWISLVVLSVIWGSSFLFTGLALQHVEPLTIVFARVGLAALALFLFCWFRGIKIPLNSKRLPQYAIMGLLGHGIPFMLIVWGQTHITAGLTSIYNATTPLFTVLVAHVCLSDERAGKGKFAGVFIGLCGVIILISGGTNGSGTDNILGQLAALTAAGSYSLSAVYGRRFSGMAPAGIATATLTAATIFMVPIILIFSNQPLILPPPVAIGSILAIALLCTAIAYIIFYRLLESAGATNVMMVTFLIPGSAIMLGILFLDETLEANHLAGLVLIFCGLILVDGQLVRYFARKRTRSA